MELLITGNVLPPRIFTLEFSIQNTRVAGGDCSCCDGVSWERGGWGFWIAEVGLRDFSSSLIMQFVGHLCVFRAVPK